MFTTKLTIKENERAFMFKNGRFADILLPGRYSFFDPKRRITFEVHQINNPRIQSTVIDSVVTKYGQQLAQHIEMVAPKDGVVGIVSFNSKIMDLIAPGTRAYFWKEAGTLSVRTVTIKDDLFASPELAGKLNELYPANPNILVKYSIPQEHIGLVYVNNAYHSTIEEGVYYAWVLGRAITVQSIDMRLLELEVTGQEVLTKDKVTIRANVVAYYNVKDAGQAIASLPDFQGYLYKQLQFAIRQQIETKTLDEILDSKSSLDEAMTTTVAESLAVYGITVRSVAIKDIILPGEMREILNQVITAEKQAQANLIKRREETAATRSLLNTAKLMDDHPMLLRLKEIEALENILQKVDNLSVYGGVEQLVGKLFTRDK